MTGPDHARRAKRESVIESVQYYKWLTQPATIAQSESFKFSAGDRRGVPLGSRDIALAACWSVTKSRSTTMWG